MRGQYVCYVPIVQIPAAEASIAGLIIPANTVIELVELTLIGGGSAANSARFRLCQFTGNTPTLSNGVTPKATDQGNAIASAITFGAKGAAGTTAVWSATPTTLADAVHGGRFEAFGGRDAWQATLMSGRRLGGASASYYTLEGVAASAVDATLRLVFNE